MRIKKYNNFQIINESFVNSEEYSNFLKDNSLSNEFFKDNLTDVEDMVNCTVHIQKMIADERGSFVKELKDGVVSRIKYMILITYKQNKDYTFDNFSNVIDDLSTIKISIQEMIDRCSDKVTLDYNKVILEGVPKTSPLEEASRTTFAIHFVSDDISDKLKSYYQKWDKSIGDQYHKMFDKLRAFYRTYDIIFDDVYDTMEDEDFINIGVFPPSEDLHHVAAYVKSTNKYTIDHQELRNSLESFPYRP
jgi:hypothetical protein